MEAYRDRQALATASATFEPAETSRPVVDLPALELGWAGQDEGPVEDQLARAVLETRTLADGYARLAPQLPPPLERRASRMADLLNAALARIFGGVT